MTINMECLEAQKIIVIKKYGSHKSYVFQEGEKVRLKLKDGSEVLEGKWWYDEGNTIALRGELVELNEILWFDVSKKEEGIFLLNKGRDLLFLAGIGFFTVNHLNVLIEPGAFMLDRQVTYISGSMVAGGLAFGVMDRAFRKRKVKLHTGRYGISLLNF